MTYDFFASLTDKLALLDYIFADTDLRLYEHNSANDAEVQEYTSTQDLAAAYDLEHGGSYTACFQLWSPRFGVTPQFPKVELNPRYVEGHTFRHLTQGWGLIQLYLGGQQRDVLSPSHIGHFNERGAWARQGSYPELGPVDAWNWAEITSTARKLKYLLHNKRAVKKQGSTGVLAGAADLEQRGIRLGSY